MSADLTSPRRYGLVALFLIAVTFAWLAPRFWQWSQVRSATAVSATAVSAADASTSEAYENSDLYQFIYPAYHYSFGQLRGGLMPLWNPRQLCGVPEQADHRVGLFQPLNLLFFLFPTEQAMALHAALCLFLMGALFAGFGRSIGLRYVPALIGGMVYAFCGASAAAMSRPATAGALAWTPLAFWAMSEWGRAEPRSRARPRSRAGEMGGAILTGAVLALLILSGAWAVSLAMLCLMAPYRLLLAIVPAASVGPGQAAPASAQALPSLPRQVAGLLLMAVVALAVSAIQWAPTAAWMWGLEHGVETFWNLSLAADVPAKGRDFLVQLFQPTHGALPRLAYVGTVPLLLIPVSFLHRSRLRETCYFAAALAVLGTLVVGYGGALPLGFPVHALVFPMVFCVATLAALGADRVLASRRAPHAPHALLPLLVLLTAGTAVFCVVGSQGRGYVLAFALILAPFFAVQTRWLSPLCGMAVAVLVFTDLAMASVNAYRHPYQDAPDCYHRYEAAIESAKEQALGARVLVAARDLDFGLPANLGMLEDLSVVGGDRIPLTRDQAVWWRGLTKDGTGAARGAGFARPLRERRGRDDGTLHPELLDFMAARVALATPDGPLYNGAWGANLNQAPASSGPRLRAAQEVGGLRLFVNEAALPRAYWVPSWRLVNGASQAVGILADPSFDPTQECLIDIRSGKGSRQLAQKAPPSPSQGDSSQKGAPCTVEDVTSEAVVVRVTAPEPGITVLADSFAPGWRATLDGEPCPILCANALFRGVATPAGAHEIVFHYRPITFGIGRAISLGALLLTVGGAVFVLANPVRLDGRSKGRTV